MLIRLVVFMLDGHQYAVQLTVVQQVVRMVEVTPLPKAPEIVLGIINVRGEIIPVLNIRKRFRLRERETNLSDQLVLAHTAGRSFALAVESVRGLLECSSDEITSADDIVPGTEYVEGVARLEDGIVLIHNLDRFLSLDEEKRLQGALAETQTIRK